MAMNDKTFSQALTFTRASTKWVFDASGTLVEVPVDQPAYDHDPVTGEALGVLIEGSRTNLPLWSEAFDNAAWTKARVTVTPNAVVSPNGTVTADKIVEDTSTDTTHLTYQIVTSLTAGGLYRASFFVKAAERSHFSIGAASGSDVEGEPLFAFFDLINQTVNNVNANANAEIKELNDGWFRCSVTFEASSTASVELSVYLAVGSNFISPQDHNGMYTGDGTSGIYIWGAQLETGSVATSYIPTAGAAVTRAADNMSRTLGAEFNYQSGTLFYEGTITQGGVVGGAWAGASGPLRGSGITCSLDGPTVKAGFRNYTSLKMVSASQAISDFVIDGPIAKVAWSWDKAGNTQRLCINGVSQGTTTMDGVEPSEFFSTGLLFQEAIYLSGAIDQNGPLTISTTEYYPRAMTATELEALTTP